MADKIASGRITLAAIGALAGLCQWLLVDVLADQMVDQPRLFLFLVSLYGTFFVALLALIGPLSMPRAALWSGAQAVIVAGLFTWSSLRFDTLEAFLGTGHPEVAIAILTLVPLPFAMARWVDGKWSNYSALFTHSWDIVVRYAAAWVFVGVAWGVVMLSDALFKLIGIDVIQQLLEIEPVPYLVTGAILGVALAVVNELSDYVSPYLVLRLLRLLLPVVLLVSAVFLLALPFRGLSHLFGQFSAAATLMAMAMGAATLVTTALDADEGRAVQSTAMRAMAQLTSLTIPALGALALAAIWLRVDQYGWTPDRLAAGTLALLVLAYGVAYAVAVLLRRNWGPRIRSINTVMALIVVAVAALWLTPVLNPQRIATNSQIARFSSGGLAADKLDIWTIGHEWGVAGEDGITRLTAMTDHPQAADMAARIAAMETTGNRFDFERENTGPDRRDLVAGIIARLPVRPEGQSVPPGLLESTRKWELDALSQACDRTTKGGHPGCLLLHVELAAQYDGPELLLAQIDDGGTLRLSAALSDGEGGYDWRTADMLNGPRFSDDLGAALDRLFEGRFDLIPVPAQVLKLGDRQIYFGP